MKSLLKIILLFIICFSTSNFSQSNSWKFVRTIKFPASDTSLVKPYLSTVSKTGRLYVISSKVDDKNAHNAIYYADPGQTTFKRLIDYDLNKDSDTLTGNIGALRGIVTLENDLIVTASQPYPKTKPNTLAALYYYTNTDTNKVEKFGFNIKGSGYGSFINGASISKDSMLITGIDFGTTFRWYNFSKKFKKSGYGSWVLPDSNNSTIFSNATEPGGPQTSGLDLIRDVALIPDGDYKNKNTHFFTSRNSISNDQQTGGIALWKGGTQYQPIEYVSYRITDFDGFLTFINFFPYGIAVDNRNYLWVAGIDSTRRWVKGFKIEGTNAIAEFDLPSKNSGDFPDPNGAPMIAPSDISFSPNYGIAYVIDRVARCAFVFENSSVDVENSESLPVKFSLEQNYPNPFNPSTMIRFSIAKNSQVKLTISDLLGREIATLIDEYLNAGTHVFTFNTNYINQKLSSGVYFYTLSSDGYQQTKKMILSK